ncbi:MAG: hypothetical protein JST92_24085, partial [Deltaproteobacteria bacterium]|nr:hypothetical protein [Deltaproteobacteria bacterium]
MIRLVLGASMLLLLLNKLVGLRYPNLEWDYPFITFDGAQWLLEGLYIRGAEVQTWGRN